MQLAALAMDELPNQEEQRAFIEAFTGSNRMIVDYLISEVLQRQAEIDAALPVTHFNP